MLRVLLKNTISVRVKSSTLRTHLLIATLRAVAADLTVVDVLKRAPQSNHFTQHGILLGGARGHLLPTLNLQVVIIALALRIDQPLHLLHRHLVRANVTVLTRVVEERLEVPR